MRFIVIAWSNGIPVGYAKTFDTLTKNSKYAKKCKTEYEAQELIDDLMVMYPSYIFTYETVV